MIESAAQQSATKQGTPGATADGRPRDAESAGDPQGSPDGGAAGGLLGGLRVIDLTLFLSGPFGTQILGDLGADVIKVEPPGGDNTRVLPPNFIAGDSAYFHSCNRNKRSIELDYRKPAGLAVLERLVDGADILIENLKPGALARHGFDLLAVRERNPRLIVCSISGFGQTGPYRRRPAYDMVIQALSGGMSLTGEKGGVPVRSGIPLADLSGGMYGVIGVLAALEYRRRTGHGIVVDISMLDCQVAMLSYQAAYYLSSGKVPGPQGREHESIPSYRTFTAGDGVDVVVCANTDRMWRSLCEALQCFDLRDEPALQDRRGRYDHRERIWSRLSAAFLRAPAGVWMDTLVACEVPVGIVNRLDRALADPQVQHRGMVLDLPHPDGETLRVAGNPIKTPGLVGPAERFPPALGQDSRDILARVAGLAPDEIEQLVAAGIVPSEGRDRPGRQP